MDFARRQLEKYGWSSGKGLGKHENGISEAIKPKLKRSVTGIGHDAAAEFNEHWWSALYDKAAKNVEVEEKNGKTKKIKTVDGEFTITNSTWRINKKHKHNDNNEYSEYFVKKAVLTNDGNKVENVTDSESDDGENAKKDAFKMTDEELFKACEGRTAHKGARHGLKALGKLARIEQQEQLLLRHTKYEGYSHAKKLKQKYEDIVEDTSIADVQEEKPKTKKKKKNKCHLGNENEVNIICELAESDVAPLPNELESFKSKNANKDTTTMKEDNFGRKTKKSGDVVLEKDFLCMNLHTCSKDNSKKSKKRKRQTDAEANEVSAHEVVKETTNRSKKKKKKKKRND